jgi:hypothetical protein
MDGRSVFMVLSDEEKRRILVETAAKKKLRL